MFNVYLIWNKPIFVLYFQQEEKKVVYSVEKLKSLSLRLHQLKMESKTQVQKSPDRCL